jgi:hypothetical protein
MEVDEWYVDVHEEERNRDEVIGVGSCLSLAFPRFFCMD